MTLKKVRAICQGGVLKPLEPVDLEDNWSVTVAILTDETDGASREILEMLDHPFHLGEVRLVDRASIHDAGPS